VGSETRRRHPAIESGADAFGSICILDRNATSNGGRKRHGSESCPPSRAGRRDVNLTLDEARPLLEMDLFDRLQLHGEESGLSVKD